MLSVDIFLCFVFLFIGFLVISTNVCSLVIIRKHWSVFEEVPRFLYQCIGVVDLIGGLSGCIYSILYIVESDCSGSQEVYNFLSMTFYFGFQISAITISCLNIDRYIAISKPLRYPSIVNIRSTVCCLALATCFPLLFLILGYVPGSPVYKLSHHDYMCLNGKVLNVNFTSSEKVTISTLYSVIMVPIGTGMTLNLISMGIATRQARAIAALAVPRLAGENDAGHRRVQLKGVKTVLFISVVNWISWVPTFVRLFVTIATSSPLSKTALVLLTMLTLVNSWSNAFIFARTNAAYRRAARESFRSIFCSQN